MAEVREMPPVLDPWPPEKYLELADEFAREAEMMREAAKDLLDQATRYSAASWHLRQAVPKVVEEPSSPTKPRGRPAHIESTQIRDFAQTHGDWFQMRELQEIVPGSRQQLLKHLKELIKQGTLEAEGYKRRCRYRFVKPEGNQGPFVAPRGEPSITNIRSKTTGPPVPHTRAQRPSGKPGQDKKKATRGIRIHKRKARGHS